MARPIWKDGHPLWKDGHPVWADACCCAYPCAGPTEGGSCPTTLQVTIGGGASGTCPMTLPNCAGLNGTYTLTRSGLSTAYYYSAGKLRIALNCAYYTPWDLRTVWVILTSVMVDGMGECPLTQFYVLKGPELCPPTGSYAQYNALYGPTCNNGMTASVA